MPAEIQNKEAQNDQVPKDETQNGKYDKKDKLTLRTTRAGTHTKTPLTELTNEELIAIINVNEVTTPASLKTEQQKQVKSQKKILTVTDNYNTAVLERDEALVNNAALKVDLEQAKQNTALAQQTKDAVLAYQGIAIRDKKDVED